MVFPRRLFRERLVQRDKGRVLLSVDKSRVCLSVTERLRGYLGRGRVYTSVTEVKCSYKPSVCLL